MSDLQWCYQPGCTKHPSPTGPPQRIQPTYGELADHADAAARWECYNKPLLTLEEENAILTLIASSTQPEHYLSAYRIAVLAGMCYWSHKKGYHVWRK